MIYLYKDQIIRIEWSIYRGTSRVLEDFSRALVKVFLIGPKEKYFVNTTAEGGKLLIDIPQGLPEGAYSLEAVYVKNWDELLPTGNTLTPSCAPIPYRITKPGVRPNDHETIHPNDFHDNGRSLMRSRIDYVFAITSVPSETDATGASENTTLNIKSSVASYGYDGLSAYETAVLHGKFEGTEGEWLEWTHERIVSDVKDLLDKLKSRDTRFVVKTKSQRDSLKDLREGDEVYVIDDGISYILKIESGKKVWNPCDYGTVTAKYMLSLIAGMPGFVADRAIADEFGKRIVDEYLTRDAVRNYMNEVFNDLFIDNSPTIMDGMITVDMLSDAVKQLIGFGPIVNFPDDEFLTTKGGRITPKDRNYDPNNYSGMGRKILRKNMVNGVNVLTQKMMSCPNTVYVITYDYSLRGQEITVPDNCVLQFEGGSISSGTIIGNNTNIVYNSHSIFSNILGKGTFNYFDIIPELFGYSSGNDSLKSIQQAVDFAYSIGINEVKLLPKVYLINYTIKVPSQFTFGGIIEAANSEYNESMTIIRPTAQVPVIELISNKETFKDAASLINIHDLYIYPSSVGSIGIYGIYFNGESRETMFGVGRLKFQRLFIRGCEYGIYLKPTGYSSVAFLEWDNVYTVYSKIGVRVEGLAMSGHNNSWMNQNIYRNCCFTDNYLGGFYVSNVHSMQTNKFLNCTFERNGTKYTQEDVDNTGLFGIRLYNVGTGPVSFDNCYFEHNGDTIVQDIDISDNRNCATVVLRGNAACYFHNSLFANYIRLVAIDKFAEVVMKDNELLSAAPASPVTGLIKVYDPVSNYSRIKVEQLVQFPTDINVNHVLDLELKNLGRNMYLETNTNLTNEQNINLSSTKILNKQITLYFSNTGSNYNTGFTIDSPLKTISEIMKYDISDVETINIVLMDDNISFGYMSTYLMQNKNINFSSIDSTSKILLWEYNNSTIPKIKTVECNISFKNIQLSISSDVRASSLFISTNSSYVLDNVVFNNGAASNIKCYFVLPTRNSKDVLYLSNTSIINNDDKLFGIIWFAYSNYSLLLQNTGNSIESDKGHDSRSSTTQQLYEIAQSTIPDGWETYNTDLENRVIRNNGEWINEDGTLISKVILINFDADIENKFNKSNVIYKIINDIDLQGGTLVIPSNCVLDFQGGSFSNGTVKGTNTTIVAPSVSLIFEKITLAGSFRNSEFYVDWFGASSLKDDNSFYIQQALSIGAATRIPIAFNSTTYKVASPIIGRDLYNIKIYGNGATLSKINTTTTGLDEELAVTGGTINIKDNTGTLCIIGGAYWHITDLYFIGGSVSEGTMSNGIVLVGVSNLFFENIIFDRNNIGILAYTCWMSQFNKISCNNVQIGFRFSDNRTRDIKGQSGTSVHFNNCYVNRSSVAYSLSYLSYSSMTCCAADFATDTAYKFENGTTLVMNACATEASNVWITAITKSNIVLNACQLLSASSSGITTVLSSSSKLLFNNCFFQEQAVKGIFSNKDSSIVLVDSEVTIDDTHLVFNTSGEYTIKIGNVFHYITFKDGIRVENIIDYSVPLKGDTTNRPILTANNLGYTYYDYTLNKPIWWDGTSWKDAVGTIV